MTKKNWKIRQHDREKIEKLASTTKIPHLLAQLFIARGLEDPQAVQDFMEPRISMLRSPKELPGCMETAKALRSAIERKKKIVVFGDYDVDGMTGTAIIVKVIKLLGGQSEYYVPSRIGEGYGVKNEALKKLKDDGAEVVITVDCGVSCCEEAQYAKEIGLELLITDHHTPGPVLPETAAENGAIAHPQLLSWKGKYYSPASEEIREFQNSSDANSDSAEQPVAYPFPHLSGSMVALKVAWALGILESGSEKVSSQFRNFLLEAIGLAAMGTVADVMPLLDENRALVHFGTSKSLVEYAPVGILALYKHCGVNSQSPKITSETIGFQISPRLNAAGRLADARLGVELLLTEKQERAVDLAEYIHNLNDTRQKLERKTLKEAHSQIKEQFERDDSAFVLAKDGWHPGIIGIVAGRLAEEYHRPVVMISTNELEAEGTGSARTIADFDLYTALDECKEFLSRFGGHASAAGLGVKTDQIVPFRAAFLEYAENNITEQMKIPTVEIDAEYPFAEFTMQTVSQIERLSPFGSENRKPIFCASEVYLAEAPKTMGADKRHFTANFYQDAITFRSYAFGRSDWVEEMAQYNNVPLDIVFQVAISTFGQRRIELQLIDWRPSK